MGNDLSDYTPAEAQEAERSAASSEIGAETAAQITPPAEADVPSETVSPVDGEAAEYFTSVTETETAMEDAKSTESATEPETIQINLSPLITLVVGLALGFLAGFVGRPYLASRSPALLARVPSEPSPASVAPSASGAQAAPTPASAGAANASTTDTTASSADTAARQAATKQLMDMLISQTRHFKGDPNAPVTMIEFSDFQ